MKRKEWLEFNKSELHRWDPPFMASIKEELVLNSTNPIVVVVAVQKGKYEAILDNGHLQYLYEKDFTRRPDLDKNIGEWVSKYEAKRKEVERLRAEKQKSRQLTMRGPQDGNGNTLVVPGSEIVDSQGNVIGVVTDVTQDMMGGMINTSIRAQISQIPRYFAG